MRNKTLCGALLALAVTFGAPGDARAGCVTNALHCVNFAWSLDSYWDAILTVDLCHRAYMECMKEKLLGL
jgi:hypothetical protein